MKILYVCSIFSLFVSFSAQAVLLDTGLTPRERWESGYTIQGAYGAHNSLFCSQKARQQVIPQSIEPDSILKMFGLGKIITVESELQQINSILNKTMTALANNSDPLIQHRHICTGFYVDRNSHFGNALSFLAGYLIFDYQLIEFLYSLPDEVRSFWVYDFLVLHEFAHQIQYWSEDPEIHKSFKGEQSSRSTELAADCVAGGLLRMLNIGLSDEVFNVGFKGVQGAAAALGSYDKENPSFHGTPTDRSFAASYGAGWVSQFVQYHGSTHGLNSQGLLKQCNEFVRTHLPE